MEMNEWDSDGFHRGLGQAGRAPRTPTLENIFEVFAKALKYCHLVESLISVGFLVWFFFFPILLCNYLFWASKWKNSSMQSQQVFSETNTHISECIFCGCLCFVDRACSLYASR